MSPLAFFLGCILFLASPAFSASEPQTVPSCDLFYITRSDLAQFKVSGQPISTLSRSINNLLKSSFDFANKLDHYTMGLASTITLSAFLNTSASLEDIKPNTWNKVTLDGSLVYRDTPFSLIPVRAAKMKISFEDKSETLVTGAQGEYSGLFYNWIPYYRFRLFPAPIFERRERLIKTMDVPFKIQVTSKVCHGSTSIRKLPLEPITFILSPKSAYRAE